MARSIQKGPFFEGPTRRSTILPHCIDNSYNIQNGKKSFNLLVTSEMVGHKFGEFIRTRQKALHVKFKKKR